MGQVNVKLSESTEDEWEEYIGESNEVASKSALVRVAVSEYIKENVGGSSGEISEQYLEKWGDTQDEILEKVQKVDNRTRDILKEVEEEKDELRDIAYQLLEYIPDKIDIEKVSSGVPILGDEFDSGDPINEYHISEYVISIEEISSEVEYGKRTIKKALEVLEEDIGGIKSTEYNEKTYYYRTG
jgi:predicted transcriptional regulator